jgi:ferredoxin
MVYIDPEVCIDCCACIPVCPVQAIYLEADLPSELERWLGLNREHAASLPSLTAKTSPLPTAAEKRAALGF